MKNKFLKFLIVSFGFTLNLQCMELNPDDIDFSKDYDVVSNQLLKLGEKEFKKKYKEKYQEFMSDENRQNENIGNINDEAEKAADEYALNYIKELIKRNIQTKRKEAVGDIYETYILLPRQIRVAEEERKKEEKERLEKLLIEKKEKVRNLVQTLPKKTKSYNPTKHSEESFNSKALQQNIALYSLVGVVVAGIVMGGIIYAYRKYKDSKK